MDFFTSYNPRNSSVVGCFPQSRGAEAACAVERARDLQQNWAARSVGERVEALRRLRDSIASDVDALAGVVCDEIGKPLQDALSADLLALVLGLDWLIAHAPRILKPRRIAGERRAQLQAVPYGVIGVIGTWNYPMLLDGTLLAAALAGGNAAVWKPSELATACAVALHSHFERAGLPVVVVTGGGNTGSALCNQPIDKLAFTGGIQTGRAILAQIAGRGIPSVMELSGNDALIVCADADVEAAAKAAVWARVCNAGQSCVSPQRLYVAQEAYAPFIQACERIMQSLRPGIDYGPLRTEVFQRRVHVLVGEAIGSGARLITGGHCLGEAPFDAGFYYAPTLLADMEDNSAVMRQDFFGPVLCARSVRNAQEAVALANDCDMGLGASVWTRDVRKGREIAAQVRAGVVTVNMETLMMGARPGLPFGGMGASGWGRTRGAAGLEEFVQWKTVCWQPSSGAQRHVFPYRAATVPLLQGVIALKTARGAAAKWQAIRQITVAARRWSKSDK